MAKRLKPIEDVTACVVDYGTFCSIAEKLAESMKTVYYYSPYEVEYQDIRDYSRGFGLEKVRKLDELYDPKVFPKIDLFVFPDIGFSSLQTHLRSLGKAVWGHMGATELELNRDLFLEVLQGVGLPVIPYEKLIGLSALSDYLRENENKWVKINRFRANMETWHHKDWKGSEDYLASLGVMLGGLREHVIFIAQDELESDLELGYDGWCVDGEYPSQSFQGYEKKNELYLGAVLADDDLPDEIKLVNKAMAPVLAEYGYRGWWATEIRVGKDGEPYFIDPTPRMPGQTGEHQQETILNFAEVIWFGANGVVIAPEFAHHYAAEATLHYEENKTDSTIKDAWKSLEIPDAVRPWVKLYHYSQVDGMYRFGARSTDEVGVVIGAGNSVQASIDDLDEHLEELKDCPVHAETSGFDDLLKSIKKAKAKGIKFGEDS